VTAAGGLKTRTYDRTITMVFLDSGFRRTDAGEATSGLRCC